MEFKWDPQKAAKNLRKHKVPFAEAATVFDDPLSVAVADPDHSMEEGHFIIVGQSYRRRLLIVCLLRNVETVFELSVRGY